MKSSKRLSRRELLRGASMAAGVLTLGGLLQACGGSASVASAPATSSLAPSSAAPTSSSPVASAKAAAPSASAKPAASAAPSTSAVAAASAAGNIKLGWLVSTTGVYAGIGADMTNGLKLYLDSVNNTAGGRKIDVLAEDEGPADGKVALEKGRKLIQQDKIDILAGVIASPDAAALRDPANDSKTVFLIANAGANVLSRKLKSKYIFRTSFSNWQSCFPAGKWFYDNVGHEAAVSAADYSAGHEDIEAFKEGFLAAGGKVTKEVYPPLANTDYASYLAEIKSASPKGLFAFFAGSDALKFVTQYNQFGLSKTIPLVSPGFLTADDVLPAEGKNALGIKGSIHYSWTLDNAENKKFVTDYGAKFGGKKPSVYALQAYDTAHVIVEAVNKTQGDVADKDKLAGAIQGIQFASPRGPFSFDPNTNNVIEHFYMFDVKLLNGQPANVFLTDLGVFKDPGK